MFKSSGRIEVRNGVRILCGIDLIKYYHYLINTGHTYKTERLQLPAHGAHITIVNPKIHKTVNYQLAKKYVDKLVEFEYYPENIYISKVNYWIPVKCQVANEIKEELNIDDGPHWWGFHLTICNKKFNDN